MGTGIVHTGRRPGGIGATCAGPPGRSPADRDGERGSILVLFALSVVLFAVLCAVVVDVGYWWVMGKKTQVAADACALAAAAQLPANWTPARTECLVAGVDYAKTNLPGEGQAAEPKHLATAVKSPYPAGPNPATYVEAQVTMAVGTFFGRFVGLDYVTVSRRAVAEQQAGAPGNYAIYSHSSVCTEGLEFNGQNHAINGRVHSNGQYLVNNGGTQPFWAQQGTRNGTFCGPAQANGTRFGGTNWSNAPPSSLPSAVAAQTWPEWFTPADFTCTVNAQKIEISGSDFKINGVNQPYPTVAGQKVIPTGVYCATELFQINGDNIRGQITALAPKIEVNGNNIDLTPQAPNNVLFYNLPNITPGGDGGPGGVPAPICTFTEEMKLANGNNSTWKGKVFHPCARVLIDGNQTSSLEGAIYGLRVKVNGNGFNMVGTGGGGDAAKIVALVQ